MKTKKSNKNKGKDKNKNPKKELILETESLRFYKGCKPTKKDNPYEVDMNGEKITLM